MQVISERRKKEDSRLLGAALKLFVGVGILLASLVTSLTFSEQLSHAARVGLSLCQRVIIPSVFPFMIIADLICVTVDFSQLRLLSFTFERIFRVNKKALSAFMLGILCGFPLGVKRIAELYESDEINKSDAEFLIGFCNNAGPAFIVSGIGVGLRQSALDGIALYLSLVLSAILVGVIFSIGRRKPESDGARDGVPLSIRFSLTDSIKGAGINTLTVCSFIVFFSCVCGALRALFGISLPYVILSSLLEVGSATSIISKSQFLSPIGSLALCGFGVGFSGLSVHLQAKTFLAVTDIKMKKYYIMKCVQGLLCAGLVSLYYFIFVA